MSDAELETWWNYWLELAQASNDQDEHEYAYGVFIGIRLPDQESD